MANLPLVINSVDKPNIQFIMYNKHNLFSLFLLHTCKVTHLLWLWFIVINKKAVIMCFVVGIELVLNLKGSTFVYEAKQIIQL